VHSLAFAGRDLDAGPPPEARLVDALRAGGHVVPACSIVAVEGDAVVGHVVCSRGSLEGATREPETAEVLGLGPLGVIPNRQRGGTGSALMHAVLGAADACDVAAVVLLGEPAFYGRFGFEPAARWGIRPPDPSWEPAFQVRRLTTWDDRLRGEFRYAAPFARL
jgi:putative acetyltransferase